MTKFKQGDQVVYMLHGKPLFYGVVVEAYDKGNQMLVKWHDHHYMKQQLIDCDNFKLLSRGGENE